MMLLEYLVESQGRGGFQPLVQRVGLKNDPNGVLYAKTWVRGERFPFFDRVDLRDSVKTLVETDDFAILKVGCEPETYGRSYTRLFLEHVQDSGPGNVNILTDGIPPGLGASYQVEDLLDSVSSSSRSRRRFRPGTPAPTQRLQPAGSSAASWDSRADSSSSWTATVRRL